MKLTVWEGTEYSDGTVRVVDGADEIGFWH